MFGLWFILYVYIPACGNFDVWSLNCCELWSWWSGLVYSIDETFSSYPIIIMPAVGRWCLWLTTLVQTETVLIRQRLWFIYLVLIAMFSFIVFIIELNRCQIWFHGFLISHMIRCLWAFMLDSQYPNFFPPEVSFSGSSRQTIQQFISQGVKS